jgi:DNA-binding response OmpR family regulator
MRDIVFIAVVVAFFALTVLFVKACESILSQEVLVRNPGKLVSQRQLLHEVWGSQYETETNYLRVYLAQIRRKLEPDPANPRYFITEARMGYRFEPDGAASH